MTRILTIEASARPDENENPSYRSLSKGLSRRFSDLWLAKDKNTQLIRRDLSRTPPSHVTERWIAAAFTANEARTEEQRVILRESDEFIGELTHADVIVIATPMYNYGMPASLKAWFDQVIRINETFTFSRSRGDFPLEPILDGKTLVLLASCGEFGFGPSGVREDMNHLTPHVRTLGRFLGAEQFHEVRVEYQEFGDDRHADSIQDAYQELARLVASLVVGDIATRPGEQPPSRTSASN